MNKYCQINFGLLFEFTFNQMRRSNSADSPPISR